VGLRVDPSPRHHAVDLDAEREAEGDTDGDGSVEHGDALEARANGDRLDGGGNGEFQPDDQRPCRRRS